MAQSRVLADFRLAFPERTKSAIPDVVRVGVMCDANTVGSEAASALRSIRFLPSDVPLGGR